MYEDLKTMKNEIRKDGTRLSSSLLREFREVNSLCCTSVVRGLGGNITLRASTKLCSPSSNRL